MMVTQTTSSSTAKDNPYRETTSYLRLLRLTGIFAGGSILSAILQLLGGFWTARLVNPAVLGLFNSIGLVLGYAGFFQLGLLHGLARELPYSLGAGDKRLAIDLTSAAQAWALLVGGGVSLVFLGISISKMVVGNYQLAAGWAVYAGGALLLFYAQHYLHTTYRTSMEFARLAMVNVVQSGVALILVVLVWWIGFYGLCLRWLLAGAVGAALLWYWRPIRVAPRWHLPHLWHLLKVGFPIFGVAQLMAWWTLLDSTLVWKFLGVEGLGLYALALMVGSTVQLLPGAITQITFPRLAEQYGRTGKLADLFGLVKKPLLFMTLGMVPVIVVAWFLVPPVARWLLPKYSPGIAAAQWSLIPVLFGGLGPMINTFNIVKRQDLYAVAIILGLLSYAGSLMLLGRKSLYLAAFPQAMTIGRGTCVGLCYLFLAYLRQREKAAGG